MSEAKLLSKHLAHASSFKGKGHHIFCTCFTIYTSGKNFNKDGNSENWWTPQSAKGFKNQTKCLVDQYSKYSLYNKNVRLENTLIILIYELVVSNTTVN